MTNRDIIQRKALDISLEYKRCGLGISMGVGKTRVAIQHLLKNYHTNIKVLVVAPKKLIYQSWLDELTKLNCNELYRNITFSTYLSLNKHNPTEYEIVYLDECHSLLFSHEIFLSKFNGAILGLTGTPPIKLDIVKYSMVQKYCPIKF